MINIITTIAICYICTGGYIMNLVNYFWYTKSELSDEMHIKEKFIVTLMWPFVLASIIKDPKVLGSIDEVK